MVKDADFFRPAQPLTFGDLVIEPNTRGLANAVVWLRPDSDDPKAAFPADKTHPKLAATEPRAHLFEACRDGFTPRVLAARAGDRVTFGNPTPVPFNVMYNRLSKIDAPMGGETGEFNILLPPGKAHTTAPLPALRFGDSVRDAIHPWVRAYVWAFDHPYFAVTNTGGKFTIPDVPAGAWRLMVWHEKVGYRNGAKGRLGEVLAVVGAEKMDLGRVVHASPGWDEKNPD